jgi:hypothetical protein
LRMLALSIPIPKAIVATITRNGLTSMLFLSSFISNSSVCLSNVIYRSARIQLQKPKQLRVQLFLVGSDSARSWRFGGYVDVRNRPELSSMSNALQMSLTTREVAVAVWQMTRSVQNSCVNLAISYSRMSYVCRRYRTNDSAGLCLDRKRFSYRDNLDEVPAPIHNVFCRVPIAGPLHGRTSSAQCVLRCSIVPV